MASYKCWKCGNLYDYKQSLARHMKLKHSKDDDAYDGDTDDDNDDDDSKDIKKESNANLSKRYDGFGYFSCHKCGQLFANQESLERHIMLKGTKKNHSLFEQYECMHCVKVFPTQNALDIHFNQTHKITEKDLAQCTSKIVFNHPFTMIVAGPTRSGKTTWVTRLLQNRLKQIKPIPFRIIWCYVHWQPMYDELKRLIPEIQWADALPTTETFETFTDSLVILDDMMDDVVNDSGMMKVFTERSHHLKISVIFMTQNIFHPGKKARTISLNTQYMVLFKNVRDRQQIKTLATQMYPNRSKYFLDKFEKATNKKYGKLILDLRPNTLEKDRFMEDEKCEEKAPSLVQSSSTPSMSQMYSQQLEQQRNALMYHDPYRAQAIEIQSKMDEVLKDSTLPENVKSLRYSDLLQDYKFAMLKSTQSTNPLLNLPVQQNALHTRPTSSLPASTLTRNNPSSSSSREHIVHDPALVQAIPSTSITPRYQRYTPSFAMRHLTPPESIARPSDTSLINFSEEEERKRPSSSSSDNVPLPEAYPSPSRDDIRRDDGDPRHGKSFVSLSDDEGTQFYKKRRSEYQFRRRKEDGDIKPVVTTPIKAKKGETSSGYFLHDIQPHKIPLPSDDSGESKDYDPDIYPKGTFLDIREDDGDEKHVKSFVSFSDDEGEKEKKEKRAEYKFRKRVVKKRKHGKKPY